MPAIEQFVQRVLDAKGPLGLDETQSDALKTAMIDQLSERIMRALAAAHSTGDNFATQLATENVDDIIAACEDSIPNMQTIIAREMIAFEGEWQPI